MKVICQSINLAQVLGDQCDPRTEQEIQSHLNECPTCQQRLEAMAADQATWEGVANHLSTMSQLPVTQELRSDRQGGAVAGSSLHQRLRESIEFVLPQVEGVSPSAKSTAASWMQILDPPRHPEMLGQIDAFEIESKIGQGGMGIVLKGYDRELNRAVAIKVLSPHLASNGTARKRFAREAQAAAAVVHPNVVPIYSVSKNPDRPYIAMQLVSGRSLQTVIDDDGPLATIAVVRVAMQIADGLTAAHQQGLIHRDVKPANVLSERGVTRVMITDFGLARAVDDVGMTQTGWLAGTPHYMSPEQAKGDDLDPRSDLFSLGSLMYFLATGREPFRAERSYGVIQKIINERPVPADQANPEVPSTLANVIQKLLAKTPDDRFQSASELAEYLKEYLAHLQQPRVAKPPVKLDVDSGLDTDADKVETWRGKSIAILAVCLFAIGAYFFAPAVWSAASNLIGYPASQVVSPEPGKNSLPMPVTEPAPLETPSSPRLNAGEPLASPPPWPPTQNRETSKSAVNLFPGSFDDSLFESIEETERELQQLERLFGNIESSELGRFSNPRESLDSTSNQPEPGWKPNLVPSDSQNTIPFRPKSESQFNSKGKRDD